MSLPARIGTCWSASALVRVKRGSTWMTFAPRALRLHDPLEADRVALGHVRAHDHDAVGVLRGPAGSVVAPPRPNEVPRPGTVELCHMRAWFSIATAPSAVKSFLIR